MENEKRSRFKENKPAVAPAEAAAATDVQKPAPVTVQSPRPPPVPTAAKVGAYRVWNQSTCLLKIGDVSLKCGRSAHFNEFDPSNPINKSYIRVGMIRIEPA